MKNCPDCKFQNGFQLKKTEKSRRHMMAKFYKCSVCGKVIYLPEDSSNPTICCGKEMSELRAGTTDAAKEKHIPVIETSSDTVKVTVGSVIHPMEEKHYIEWIALETNQGISFKHLKPGSEPKAEFRLAAGETVKAAYAYCNLHGLWMAS